MARPSRPLATPGPWTGYFVVCSAPTDTARSLVLAMLTACVPPPTNASEPSPPPSEGFSGARALTRLEALMELPRTLGHPERQRSIAALADMLAEGGAAPAIVPFEAVDRDGTRFALANVVADYRPDAPRRFVLATHFDTRPWADEDPDPAAHAQPVPGANDGTSGVAVILELVPVLLSELPPEVGFTVVLFDGEELGHESDRDGYCAGSRQLLRDIEDPRYAMLRRASFGIVLDMVGDRDLRLAPEPSSIAAAPALVDHVWSTARAHGLQAFDPTPRERGIVDDHKFLTAAGVPSILVIDHDYTAWHTTRDTIDRVDARSLAAVGEALRLSLGTWAWSADAR